MKRKLTYQPNEKLMRAAKAYKGKWIAVLRDEIVLSGDDPLVVKREATERGIEYDVIDYVADWGGRPPKFIL